MDCSAYRDDIWSMTAKIAAKHFDYTEYPSGYCLFDTFCPSDKTDEVLENALEWKKIAREYYTFSEDEKEAALPLYRCLKPLWWGRVEELKDAGSDRDAVKRSLDGAERYLTMDIDFKSCM
ncbi:MAG: hypothetical protein J6Z46_06895 [Lachnospiraceae bacterium]|nr:hypothetical protein [Lachnospiraceae bacterium]